MSQYWFREFSPDSQRRACPEADRPWLHPFNQLRDGDTECFGNGLEGIQRNHALSALTLRHVATIDAKMVAQLRAQWIGPKRIDFSPCKKIATPIGHCT